MGVRRRLHLVTILVALAAGGFVFLSQGGASTDGPETDGPAGAPKVRVVFGKSLKGRPLVAVRIGDPTSSRKALVVGVIHGDETAGAPVIRELRRRYAAIRPPIHDMLIPFPAKRKHEMAAYSKRHYGVRQWRLKRVRLIVEHLSVTSSVAAVYNTFAPDHPDGEFGELPNTCAHYVIGSSGAIFRLVPTTIRCRHVVGLNHVAVGIEHVGYAESDVLRNPRQLRASLRLTRWLRCRYNLKPSGVIGHNESLSSPFYRELDPRFRGQTHGDWRPPYMRRYRRMLRSLGACPTPG